MYKKAPRKEIWGLWDSGLSARLIVKILEARTGRRYTVATIYNVVREGRKQNKLTRKQER